MTDDVQQDGSVAISTDAEAVAQKRKRGRPPKGDPVLVRLAAEERAVAESLGGGVVAEGIRLALVAAGKLGVDNVRLLASENKALSTKVERSGAQDGHHHSSEKAGDGA